MCCEDRRFRLWRLSSADKTRALARERQSGGSNEGHGNAVYKQLGRIQQIRCSSNEGGRSASKALTIFHGDALRMVGGDEDERDAKWHAAMEHVAHVGYFWGVS